MVLPYSRFSTFVLTCYAQITHSAPSCSIAYSFKTLMMLFQWRHFRRLSCFRLRLYQKYICALIVSTHCYCCTCHARINPIALKARLQQVFQLFFCIEPMMQRGILHFHSRNTLPLSQIHTISFTFILVALSPIFFTVFLTRRRQTRHLCVMWKSMSPQ